MTSPLRVTLSADPVEGRVLPSAVFVRPPHALDARAAAPVSAQREVEADDRRERPGADRLENRRPGRFGIRDSTRSDDRSESSDRRGSDDRSVDPGPVIVRYTTLIRSEPLVQQFRPVAPLPFLIVTDGSPLPVTRAPAARPSAVLADTPTEPAGQAVVPAAVESDSLQPVATAARTEGVAPPTEAQGTPVRTGGEQAAAPTGAAVANSLVPVGAAATAPPAGATAVPDAAVTPEVMPPPLPEVAPLPTAVAVVPALVAEAAAAFPALAPLVGVLPADAEAIEQAAAAVVSHVAALADAVPAAVAGPEGYAWVTAGVCLAGGLAFAARGHRRPRRPADPVTLGTDSVFAQEARRDSDFLGR